MGRAKWLSVGLENLRCGWMQLSRQPEGWLRELGGKYKHSLQCFVVSL